MIDSGAKVVKGPRHPTYAWTSPHAAWRAQSELGDHDQCSVAEPDIARSEVVPDKVGSMDNFDPGQ
jgi:hypothetical protein